MTLLDHRTQFTSRYVETVRQAVDVLPGQVVQVGALAAPDRHGRRDLDDAVASLERVALDPLDLVTAAPFGPAPLAPTPSPARRWRPTAAVRPRRRRDDRHAVPAHRGRAVRHRPLDRAGGRPAPGDAAQPGARPRADPEAAGPHADGDPRGAGPMLLALRSAGSAVPERDALAEQVAALRDQVASLSWHRAPRRGARAAAHGGHGPARGRRPPPRHPRSPQDRRGHPQGLRGRGDRHGCFLGRWRSRGRTIAVSPLLAPSATATAAPVGEPSGRA